jgi:hypothetical protein
MFLAIYSAIKCGFFQHFTGRHKEISTKAAFGNKVEEMVF